MLMNAASRLTCILLCGRDLVIVAPPPDRWSQMMSPEDQASSSVSAIFVLVSVLFLTDLTDKKCWRSRGHHGEGHFRDFWVRPGPGPGPPSSRAGPHAPLMDVNHRILADSAKASCCIYRKTNETVKGDLMLDLFRRAPFDGSSKQN